jgi:selenocysteine lyase/cysteine desulfurase
LPEKTAFFSTNMAFWQSTGSENGKVMVVVPMNTMGKIKDQSYGKTERFKLAFTACYKTFGIRMP